MVQRELDATTLRAEIESLRSTYLATVGVRYSTRDNLKEQLIAEARRPRRREYRARTRAHTRERELGPEVKAGSYHVQGPDGKSVAFCPSDRLKTLYRDVAKAIHPDLASDDSEHPLRTKLMAEANSAYASGDEARLEAILAEWRTSPDAVKGSGVAADLVRVIRRIARVQRRLASIEEEIQESPRDRSLRNAGAGQGLSIRGARPPRRNGGRTRPGDHRVAKQTRIGITELSDD